jgi:DnaJ-class molecular chaperone
LLQLPLGKSLALPEIRQAFRRAAKMVHPDMGGSEEAFRELIAAQEMLMHRGAYGHE